MNWPGFLGQSYAVQSPNAACELAMNLYAEPLETNSGKTQMAMYGTPGLTLAIDLSGNAVRGAFAENGRVFVAVDSRLVELQYLSGTFSSIERGPIVADGNPVTFASNGTGGNQLALSSGGNLYVLNLLTNVLTQVTSGLAGQVAMVDFTDGYVVALIANSSQFQISALDDASSWASIDVGQVSESSDLLQTLIINQRTVWLLGQRTSEPWFDFGTTFPFGPISGGFIEAGSAAAYSAVRLDNTIFWIHQSERGARMAVKAAGPSAQRVSTFGVEYQWAQYSTVADAIGWSYEEQGHAFWVIYFPTANATWVYDAATQRWHQRDYRNPTTGESEAYLGRCYCFGFGLHLVGARNSGKVYIQAIGTEDYDSTPRVWKRRTAHLCDEQRRQIHKRFQVDCQVGVGLATGQGSNPLMTLRWSDDGGSNFSNGRVLNMGALGQNRYRAFTTNLGQTRDRVYELSGSEPVRTALLAAYLDVEQGLS